MALQTTEEFPPDVFELVEELLYCALYEQREGWLVFDPQYTVLSTTPVPESDVFPEEILAAFGDGGFALLFIEDYKGPIMLHFKDITAEMFPEAAPRYCIRRENLLFALGRMREEFPEDLEEGLVDSDSGVKFINFCMFGEYRYNY